MTDVWIDLSADDRQALLELIQLQGISIGEAIANADDIPKMRVALGEAATCARLCSLADGGASLGTADVRRLGDLVSRNQKEALDAAEQEMKDLPRLEAGDPQYVFAGRSVEESVSATRRDIEHEVHAGEAYGRILDRLVEAVAA